MNPGLSQLPPRAIVQICRKSRQLKCYWGKKKKHCETRNSQNRDKHHTCNLQVADVLTTYGLSIEQKCQIIFCSECVLNTWLQFTKTVLTTFFFVKKALFVKGCVELNLKRDKPIFELKTLHAKAAF